MPPDRGRLHLPLHDLVATLTAHEHVVPVAEMTGPGADIRTATLDLVTGRSVLDPLRPSARTTRRAVLPAAPDSTATGMADRVVRLRHGRIARAETRSDPIRPREPLR